MEQKLKNGSIQPRQSPIILFPFSSRSLIKTTVCLERKGWGCSKVKQDVQVISLCIWSTQAPIPCTILDHTVTNKPPLLLRQFAVEMQLDTAVCPMLSWYLAATSIGCILAPGTDVPNCSKGPNLLAGPKQKRQAMPLYIHSHSWISLLL